MQRDSEEAKGVSGGLEFAAMIEIAESVGMRDTLGSIAEQCADLMGQNVAEIATAPRRRLGQTQTSMICLLILCLMQVVVKSSSFLMERT